MKAIRVVAADDSAVMRSLLERMFSEGNVQAGSHPRMELVAAVQDGASCLHAVRTLQPDVVLMDLNMPGVDGREAVMRLRQERPRLPIIMCSTYTRAGAASTLEALALGASDYVTKPTAESSAASGMASLWAQLAPKILALSGASRIAEVEGKASYLKPGRIYGDAVKVIAIGVSTGGPAALERLLPRLPRGFAVPVVIVQHMPKLFTGALAERLNRCCVLPVREAKEGAMLADGGVWLAQGDSHLAMERTARGELMLTMEHGEAVCHCRPSVDVLFRSVAESVGAGGLGVVLTGMGSDGVEGSRSLVEAGARVIAQDQRSSAVWGMPGRVVEAALASDVLPLDEIAKRLVELVRPHCRVGFGLQKVEAGHGV